MNQREGFVVRRMTRQDLDEICVLEQMIFPDPWSRQSFESELNGRERPFVYVAHLHGSIAGYSVFSLVAGEAEILNMAVAPAWRRSGIGDIMLIHAQHQLLEHGAEVIYLELRCSNFAARCLYEKHGFERIGKRPGYYIIDSEDAIIMRKHLGQDQNRYKIQSGLAGETGKIVALSCRDAK